MPNLSPPLQAIEDALFGVPQQARTPGESGDTMSTPETEASVEEEAPIIMPAYLAEMIEQRVAARTQLSQDKPSAGQILRVDQAIGPNGPLDWSIDAPLAVLIAKPLDRQDVWQGWVVSHEPDYATYLDMLLEEEDHPCDPLARMVQLWNPIQLYIPSTSRVLAKLSTERLATAQEIYAEFLHGVHPDADQARAGALIERYTKGHHLALCGTPMGDEHDPRWHYQELYFRAGLKVTEVARLALDRRRVLDAVVDYLRRAAYGWGLPLLPVAEPQWLAGESAEPTREALVPQAWEVPGLIHLEMVTGAEDKAYAIRVRCLCEAPLIVRLVSGDSVRQQLRLDISEPEGELFGEVDRGDRLVIEDSAGNIRDTALP